jgi:peptidoglycan/LPS O-acetylase OafA/YrhL
MTQLTEPKINKPTIEHIKPLTSLRGIAAIIITIHHFSIALVPSWGQAIETQTKLMKNCYLCVDLFFILSGFILSHVYINHFQKNIDFKSYKSFLTSRFARIYPLHIFTLLVFVGLEFIKLAYYQWRSNTNPNLLVGIDPPFTGAYDPPSILTNILLLQAIDYKTPPLFDIVTYWNQPSWSISAEFAIYLIFPFLLLLVMRKRNFSLGLIGVAAFLAVCWVLKSGNLNHSGIPSLIRCSSECILGIISYKIYKKGLFQKWLEQDWLANLALLGILLTMHFGWIFLPLIFPLCCLLILCWGTNKGMLGNFLSSKPMVFLGTISYSLYLVHWFLQELFKFIWQAKFHRVFDMGWNFYQSSAIVTIGLGISILVATFTYRWFELPMRQKLKLALNNKL